MTIFTNGLKTAILLGLLMGLCVGVGYAIGRFDGMLIGLVLGGTMTLVSYFFSDKIALASVGAQPLSPGDAPQLHDIVQRLATRAGIPTPRLYLAPQAAPNAFATGRGPSSGVVCVTTGLLDMMDESELEGVLAHEISHIKHRDILISTIAAIIAGAIASVSHMFMWFGFGGRRDRESSPIDLIVLLLTIILAPIAAALIQLAISRSREYAADARGAQLAGGPEGLINALRKLEIANRRIPLPVNPAERHMFIIMPMSDTKGGGGGGFMELFRTHPPTEKRIAKLIEQLGQPSPYALSV